MFASYGVIGYGFIYENETSPIPFVIGLVSCQEKPKPEKVAQTITLNLRKWEVDKACITHIE